MATSKALILRQVRIFGAMKDERHDRQIGDRRGMNYKEDRVIGPSSTLPNGSDLADLYVDLGERRVHVAVCDRKDFYHQIMVSRRRARSACFSAGGHQGVQQFLSPTGFPEEEKEEPSSCW